MSKKTPKKVVLIPDYDGSDYPSCPTCGEIAYYLDKCCFCGQVFDQEDERLKEFNQTVQIERDGYTIVQASNCHIHVYNADGKMIYHASCTKKMTEDELIHHLEFVKSLIKGA